MHKIAVIGDKDSISGFSALGFEVCPSEDAARAAEEIRRMADNDYAVIFITEGLASKIQDEIDRYSERSTPAVILIPGITGNTGEGLANLKKAVEKAVGSDILN